MDNQIILGSLFDGIAGFPEAGRRVGITVKWASEIEPFPMKVSAIRFPDMEQLGDITKLNSAELEPVDVITGGSPCQDLSVAGKRAGLAGNRSGLFMEQIRIVREMRNADKLRLANAVSADMGEGGTANVEKPIAQYGFYSTNQYIRPRFMVWENVPGAFSSNKGEDFRAVLEETARIADETVVIPGPPKGKWPTVGCIMGDDWSVAWRMLDAQYWGVPQRRRRIFLVADFGGQSAPEILFKREGLSRHLAESREAREGITADAEGGIDETVYDNHGNDSRWTGPVKASQPITSNFGMGGNNQLFVVGKAIGFSGKNSATLNLCPSEELSPTLRSGAETHVMSFDGYNQTLNETAQTIRADKTDGDHVGMVINCQPSGISGTVSSKWTKGTGGPAGDEHYNLVVDEVANCLKAKANLSYRLDSDTAVKTGYSVRRLTPLECERLQNFPDHWTDIPGASDSGRYKALGNSVAVCCPEYVLEGIRRCYP